MRIFSNFDTKLRQNKFSYYQEQYGVENVLCFGRSKLYRWIKCALPITGYTIALILGIFFFNRRLGSSYIGYITIILSITYIVAIIPCIGKYIDYKMDFIIVIPSSIMLYDQGGILKKNVVTISAVSVKSVSVKKSGLLYSFFDNGDILILTEGDIEQNGEIRLRRVPRPEKRRNHMLRVIGIDVRSNPNPR